MNSRNHLASLMSKLMLAGFLIVATTGRVFAGPIPMPVETDLDDASLVVFGDLIRIEIEATDRVSNGLHYGKATVAVKETLKGKAAKTAEFTVVVQDDYGDQRASIVPIYRIGQSGIWVVNSSGDASNYFGLIAAARKADVQQRLKMLAERKWSEPVNGLQACAAVIYPDYRLDIAATADIKKFPAAIFAVKNVSDKDIFVPTENAPGFISAKHTDSNGNTRECISSRAETNAKATVFCRKLAPGKTIYLHPQYSFISLPQKLAPGKYTVAVACKNELDGDPTETQREKLPVNAWKGELKAPPVEYMIEANIPKPPPKINIPATQDNALR